MSKKKISAGLFLAITLILSCSSTDVPELPSQEVSSSGGEQQDWCVYISSGTCSPVTSEGCTGEGILAPVCPYNSSSSVYSSSEGGGESSSSSEDSSSSSSSVEEYSSSSVVSSSSSELLSSSSSVDSSSSSELPSSSSSVVSSSSSELPSSSSSVVSSSSSELPSSSSSSEANLCGSTSYNPTEQFCDTRDNKIYKFVEIDTQTWMAENLNYKAIGSVCYNYEDDKCAIYGSLYNWETAKTVCPSGWHLPSDDEWIILINYLGSSIASRYLKATSGWRDCGPSDDYDNLCEDTYGFTALSGGGYYTETANQEDASFIHEDQRGCWWSATENDASRAFARLMHYYNELISSHRIYKSSLFSIRCLKDD